MSTYLVHVGAAAAGAPVRGAARSACHAWAAVDDGWTEVLVAAAAHTDRYVATNKTYHKNEHDASMATRHQV